MLAALAPAEPKDGLTDPDDVPEPPDEAITKPGDLWLLGDHRLLCGDAGSEADLDRLLDGVTVDLFLTDPPYNVKVEPRSNNAIAAGMAASYDESYQAALASSSRKRGTKALDAQGLHHSGFDVARGKSGIRTTRSSISSATPRRRRPPTASCGPRTARSSTTSSATRPSRRCCWPGSGTPSRVLRPGGSFYVWGGYANLGNYPLALKAAGLYFSQAIIWDKEHPVLTRKDLMGAHEWALYGWKEGAAHRFFGPSNATDLWHVKKVSPNAMVHLTEKPVELARRAIEYSLAAGRGGARPVRGLGLDARGLRADRAAGIPHGDRPALRRCRGRQVRGVQREEGRAGPGIGSGGGGVTGCHVPGRTCAQGSTNHAALRARSLPRSRAIDRSGIRDPSWRSATTLARRVA